MQTADSLSYTYELTDHLGNVRAVVQKKSNTADITNATDYYPFGWRMPGRVSIGGNRYRFGYQGQFSEYDPETGYNQFEARLLDTRIGRWLTTDPAGQYASPYLGMGNNPINGVDPDGKKNVRFDKNGNYLGVDKNVWWHNLLFGTRGQYANGDGGWVNFRFNDVNDIAGFEKSPGQDGYLSGIDVDNFSNNFDAIVNRQINPAKQLGIKEKYKYIYHESMAGGKLDFLPYSSSDKLSLFTGHAYNNHDAGNLAWGQALKRLNVPFSHVKIGSEWNAFWNGKLQNGEWGPHQPTLKRITWTGDSSADQRAIFKGYHSAYVNGVWFIDIIQR